MDILFENKMNNIWEASFNEKKLDIKNYILKKRQIDFHIDHKKGVLIPRTKEECEPLTKYKPFLYYNHLTISEMASCMSGASISNLEKYKCIVFEELKPLYDKDLINGVKLNEVDKEILYYKVEEKILYQ